MMRQDGDNGQQDLQQANDYWIRQKIFAVYQTFDACIWLIIRILLGLLGRLFHNEILNLLQHAKVMLMKESNDIANANNAAATT